MTNKDSQPILQLDGVTKAFGGLMAVNDLSFSVWPGELISIIGPNGAGKTTLINLTAGIFPPTAGKIWFKGRKIDKLPSQRIASLGIARTFQDVRIFTNMSVVDNIIVGTHRLGHASLFEIMTRLGRTKKEEQLLFDEAMEKLAMVGLEKKATLPTTSLSVREHKLLAIARCLAAKPELLLLDEPAGGLSFEEIKGLADFIQILRGQGMTIIFIEHRMEIVMGISERVIVLNFGEKIAEDIPARIQENKAVISAYLGEEET
ncbi:ABC transporter ATP-binding protein [Chloroflexota bacterium]